LGRKRLPENERKVTLTVGIRKELVDKLRKIDNYNLEIEKLIENFLKEKEKDA